MSNQLQITGGAKVKNLEGAIVGSSGVLSSVGLGVANGVATLGTDGKVPSNQLPTLASSYKGTWNAATNTPTIADGVGTAGDYYLVSTGGVWNGITFIEGQTVIYSGTIWQKAGSAAGVTSVALTAPAAFTVSGSPITSTGTLAINAAGTTAQYISGAGTLVTFPTNLVTTDRTVNTTSPLQGGGTLSSDLTLTIQQAGNLTNGYLSGADWATFMNKESTLTFYSPLFRSGSSVFISQATTTTSGYLSSTDWNTFNNKVQGSGLTAGKIPFATGSSSLGDTNLNYNGGFFGFGTAASTYRIDVSGSVNVTGNYYINGVALNNNYLPLTGGTLSGNITYSPGDATDWFIDSPYNGPNIRLKYSVGTTNRSGALAWKDNSGVRSDVLYWVENLITSNYPIVGNIGTFTSSLTTPDVRSTGAGYITYDTDALGTGSLILRSGFAGSVLYFDGVGAAIFSNTIAAKKGTFTTATNPLTIESTNTTLYQTFRHSTTTDVGYIGNGLGISSGGSASDFGIQSVGNMIFSAGGSTERARIMSTGNVLIGTITDNGYLLNVAGTVNSSNVFRSANGFMNSYESYNNWELGKRYTTSGLTVLTTQYVSIRINGTVYKLALVQEPTPP